MSLFFLAVTNTDNGAGGNTRVNTFRNELAIGSLDFSGTNRGQIFDDYVLGVNRINNSYMKGFDLGDSYI